MIHVGDRFSPVRCTARDGASFGVCRHGGHLLSFVPASGHEIFFVSDRAVFAPGAAIRGGVPVIFPQFAGRGPLPKHGFARTGSFTVDEAGVADDGAAFARLSLVDDAASRAVWPESFRLSAEIRALGDTLEQTLRVTNTGAATFAFTAALHGYFGVADVRAVSIEGLDDVRFEDHASVCAADAPLRFEDEIDRVYVAAPAVRLRDGARSIALSCEGFREWVVWNPGDAKAAALTDLGAENGRRFVCVEPAVARAPILLAAGETWSGTQRVVVTRS